MRITIEEARALAEGGLRSVGYSAVEAETIADHLMDSELRGVGHIGLARALLIMEHMEKVKPVRRPISVLKETPVSIVLDGGNTLGYLVGSHATDLAIEKARQLGIAIVGASKTYYTGTYSYYLERVVAAGYVGMIAGSGPSSVAPFGGTEPRFCTNPIAFGFPSDDVPVIWDIATSAYTHAEVALANRLGEPMPEGAGFDVEGRATTDAGAILNSGTMSVWGGHRGSGLAMSIQLLSMMVGQVNAYVPAHVSSDFGYFILVMDPGLFGSAEDFKRAVSDYARDMRETRPADPARPVRVPFERSDRERRMRLADGHLEVADKVVETLRAVRDAQNMGDA